MKHIDLKLQDVLKIGDEYIHLIFSSSGHCVGGFKCNELGEIDLDSPLTTEAVADKCREIPLETLVPYLHEEGYPWEDKRFIFRFLALGNRIFGVRVYKKRFLCSLKIYNELPIQLYANTSFFQEWHEANQMFWSGRCGITDSIFPILQG